MIAENGITGVSPLVLWLASRGSGTRRVTVAVGAKSGYCGVCFRECGNGVFVLQAREPIQEMR